MLHPDGDCALYLSGRSSIVSLHAKGGIANKKCCVQVREDVEKQVSTALQTAADAESSTATAREQCAESVAAATAAVATANSQVAAAQAAHTDAERSRREAEASHERCVTTNQTIGSLTTEVPVIGNRQSNSFCLFQGSHRGLLIILHICPRRLQAEQTATAAAREEDLARLCAAVAECKAHTATNYDLKEELKLSKVSSTVPPLKLN